MKSQTFYFHFWENTKVVQVMAIRTKKQNNQIDFDTVLSHEISLDSPYVLNRKDQLHH